MIIRFIKNIVDKEKKSNKYNGVFTAGYHTFGGLIAGMIIADIWDKYNLPGNDKTLSNSLVTGQPIEKSEYSQEKLFQNMIAGGVMLLELFGVKGALHSGLGMFIGINYVNTSKKGDYIGDSVNP